MVEMTEKHVETQRLFIFVGAASAANNFVMMVGFAAEAAPTAIRFSQHKQNLCALCASVANKKRPPEGGLSKHYGNV